jgi:hypothetical protein
MSEASAIIEQYAKALQFSLAYVPSGDRVWDHTIANELRRSGVEVREHGLDGTPAYFAAIRRAEQFAAVIQARS